MRRKRKPPRLETVKLKKLKPWGKNPRKDHAVDGIAKSIEAYGYLSPIIVQARTYRILAGHGRYQALQNLGTAKVPVIVADVTDKEADGYTIADNRFTDLSEFDSKQLVEQLRGLSEGELGSVGFTEDDLEDMIAKELEERDLRDVDLKTPPKMAWVLVGIPTVRYGEISNLVAKIAAVKNTFVESTVNDGNQDR